MDWEMHLYVERQVGERWVPVCPPLPASPRSKPKWGRYKPADPIEDFAATVGGTDFVPSKAARWDFGHHPAGMQQLCEFYSYVWHPNATREEEEAGQMDPFLVTCGIPESASPQVKQAAKDCSLGDSDGIWYTLRELNEKILVHSQDRYNLPDKRVVALREALAKVVTVSYPDVCDCKRKNCRHRDRLIRAVVWRAKIKKPKREG